MGVTRTEDKPKRHSMAVGHWVAMKSVVGRRRCLKEALQMVIVVDSGVDLNNLMMAGDSKWKDYSVL